MLSLPITELDIQALINSHLSWEEEKQVLEALRTNPSLHAYYTRLVAQKRLLVAWWGSEEEKEARTAALH